ncbi:hypothetical protein [Thalassotalea sp. Y01]|uniref:hypothetical protein n=1 Tax=Thalassotalea sp. Y01 TaxID=2729613 RepID=UPI00145DC6CB|nr:hypothetical protein [Thalassotalea sp. Y01]NMP15448.1 hypothetical protein [Thalassotalea sp. Y01]
MPPQALRPHATKVECRTCSQGWLAIGGVCYKCGRSVAKGKGHPEKTNKAHYSIGIRSKWVIRCDKCVGVRFSPNIVTQLGQKIIDKALAPDQYSLTAWFDERGLGYLKIRILSFESRNFDLTTMITSNHPSGEELEEKRNAFQLRLEQIKASM